MAMSVLPRWKDDPPTRKLGESKAAAQPSNHPLPGVLCRVLLGPQLSMGSWPDNQHFRPLAKMMGSEPGGNPTSHWVSVLDFHWEYRWTAVFFSLRFSRSHVLGGGAVLRKRPIHREAEPRDRDRG